MTQREALIQEISEVINAGFFGAVDGDAMNDLAAEVAKVSEPQWHKFDKDDETTWPPKIDELYWVVVPDGDKRLVVRDRFTIVSHWPYVTHWQEIPVPSQPEVES